MSVKSSCFLGFSKSMRSIGFLGVLALCTTSLTACSGISGFWHSLTHDRDEQIVSGPKRLPKYNDSELLKNPPIPVEDNQYKEFTTSAPEKTQAPLLQYKNYVPVEGTEMSTPPQSQPVILKNENSQMPYGEQNDSMMQTPMPSNEPSVFDNISGWFSSSTFIAPAPYKIERMVTVLTPMGNVENVMVNSSAVTNYSASSTELKHSSPAEKSLSQNPAENVTKFDESQAFEVVGDDEEYPPLSSVPPTPVQFEEVRKEHLEAERALKEMHEASQELSAALDAQRKAEAVDSLLKQSEAESSIDNSAQSSININQESVLSQDAVEPQTHAEYQLLEDQPFAPVTSENATSAPVLLQSQAMQEAEASAAEINDIAPAAGQDASEIQATEVSQDFIKEQVSSKDEKPASFMSSPSLNKQVVHVEQVMQPSNKVVSITGEQSYKPVLDYNQRVRYLPKSRY